MKKIITPLFFKEMRAAVEKAGRFQMKHFRSAKNQGHEKALREMVSFVDVESENILRRAFEKILPGAGFFGEESGRQDKGDLQWIVDPLDGTTNYLSGVEQFSISAALTFKNKPLAGMILRPASGEIFHGAKNMGAFCNGKKLSKVKPRPLRQSLTATGFPYRSPDSAEAFFKSAAEVLTKSRGIRRFGSAALDLAWTAAGRFQAFWEIDLQPYDCAAALVLLAETGCKVSDFHGKEYDMFGSRTLAASHPPADQTLIAILKKHYSTELLYRNRL